MRLRNLKFLAAVLIVGYPISVLPQTGGTFDLSHSVIATGGGSNSTGGQFQVDGTAGQGFAGTVSNAATFDVHGGFWFQNKTSAPGAQIAGTVTYGNAAVPPKYISHVLVTGTGSPDVFAFTSAPGPTSGQYTLTGFGAGSYTVSLSKTTGLNSITSNDAARIAQHVAGVLTLTTDNQRVSADVTGNGAISSQDAAKIAQFAAGIPFSPPNLSGTWRFFVPPGPTFPVGASPTTRTYSSVMSNVSGEDYIGLLMGEVTGNWTPTAARPETSRQKAEAEGSRTEGSIAVELPSVAGSADREVAIPVRVQGIADKGVISYEFDLRYDPSVIQPTGDVADVTGSVSSSLKVVTNSSERGLLRVVVYGPMPIDADGVLINLRFKAVGMLGSQSPLSMQRIMFNEGTPRAATTDGQVELF